MKTKLLFFIIVLFLGTAVHAQSIASKAASDNKSGIVVFPNPATNYIGVTDKQERVETVFVYNLVGRKIKTFYTEDSDRFYIADLPDGIYLVQLKGYDGKIIKTQRLRVR